MDYRILDSGGTPVESGDIIKTGSSKQSLSLNPNSDYTAEVRYSTASGNSGWAESNVTSLSVVDPVASNLSFSGVGTNSIGVAGTFSGGYAMTWELDRRVLGSGSAYTQIASSGALATATSTGVQTASGLVHNTLYEFRLSVEYTDDSNFSHVRSETRKTDQYVTDIPSVDTVGAGSSYVTFEVRNNDIRDSATIHYNIRVNSNTGSIIGSGSVSSSSTGTNWVNVTTTNVSHNTNYYLTDVRATISGYAQSAAASTTPTLKTTQIQLAYPDIRVDSYTINSIDFAVKNRESLTANIEWSLREGSSTGNQVASGTRYNVGSDSWSDVDVTGLSQNTSYTLRAVTTISGYIDSELSTLGRTTDRETTEVPIVSSGNNTISAVYFSIQNKEPVGADIYWEIRRGSTTGTLEDWGSIDNMSLNQSTTVSATGLQHDTTYWLTNVSAQGPDGRIASSANAISNTTDDLPTATIPDIRTIGDYPGQMSFYVKNQDSSTAEIYWEVWNLSESPDEKVDEGG